jgi:exosortase C (VPDSG-CTERM-specific)
LEPNEHHPKIMPPEHIENLSGVNLPASRTSTFPGIHSDPARNAQLKRGFKLAVLGLVLAFIVPLWQLASFAARSELYSYILLIPFISVYLSWLKRKPLPVQGLPLRGLATVFLAGGSLVLIAYWLHWRPQIKTLADDYLAFMMVAFLFLFWGVCCWFHGRHWVAAKVFPLAFLVFLVPIPSSAITGIETFLQHGSAVFAKVFFLLAGTPFVQDGLAFQLPGISLMIAPECSGIRSSLVLFITSLVASYCFLTTPWKRTLFVVAIIPLGLIRNGFRVFTIGELCVHIGPHMIDSPIHHRGGPLFFALSLIPLFLLLIFLYRSERVRGKTNATPRDNQIPKTPQ